MGIFGDLTGSRAGLPVAKICDHSVFGIFKRNRARRWWRWWRRASRGRIRGRCVRGRWIRRRRIRGRGRSWGHWSAGRCGGCTSLTSHIGVAIFSIRLAHGRITIGTGDAALGIGVQPTRTTAEGLGLLSRRRRRGRRRRRRWARWRWTWRGSSTRTRKFRWSSRRSGRDKFAGSGVDGNFGAVPELLWSTVTA